MNKAAELRRISKNLSTLEAENYFIEGGSIIERLTYLSIVARAKKLAKRSLTTLSVKNRSYLFTPWLDEQLRYNGFIVVVDYASGKEVFDSIYWG